MEKAPVDVEKILASFQTLQERVEHVIVEGAGGWLVPIRPDYLVSDLAAAMNTSACSASAFTTATPPGTTNAENKRSFAAR